MDRSYRARAAGSDSVSYARRISRKSGPPPAGAASGWNRLAMARYAVLISRAVAVSPTLSTWYILAGALLLPAAVATSATTRLWAEMPLAGGSEIPEKMTVPDMGEVKSEEEKWRVFVRLEHGSEQKKMSRVGERFGSLRWVLEAQATCIIRFLSWGPRRALETVASGGSRSNVNVEDGFKDPNNKISSSFFEKSTVVKKATDGMLCFHVRS
ncbi:hypothetical protein BHE74_00022517 [Ensete ventricosum]|nr:hypothetical protein BHE74_00022517 [Ensete ventricosum]